MGTIENMRAAYASLAAIGDRTAAQRMEAIVLAAFLDGYESGVRDAQGNHPETQEAVGVPSNPRRKENQPASQPGGA